jgi:hypothetical protein
MSAQWTKALGGADWRSLRASWLGDEDALSTPPSSSTHDESHQRLSPRSFSQSLAIIAGSSCWCLSRNSLGPAFHSASPHPSFAERRRSTTSIMNLVSYSDSGSEDESAPDPPKPSASFHKLIDRSTHKIRVSLPSETPTEPERAAKRQRTNGGPFAGLSSLLPAPKNSSTLSSNTGRGRGNRPSLKTGATPAFARAGEESAQPTVATQLDAAEVKLVGRATVFKPLSVARKPAKNPAKAKTVASRPEAPLEPPPERPKVSLFSMGVENTDAAMPDELAIPAQADEQESGQGDQTPAPAAPQTLSSVASELQLDEATRRQLFGRQGDEQIKLVNFNTDQEYTANEVLRASGDTAQHNPLRAIQPGKHSLRQLINAAATQKDALEESWAAGKRNKKEAGNRYGW